jgi:hypothetical protein
MDGEPVRHQTYVAYMLRLWQAGSRGGQMIWRASLENPHTGERLAFGDEEALFAFLADLMADLADTRDLQDRGELRSTEMPSREKVRRRVPVGDTSGI